MGFIEQLVGLLHKPQKPSDEHIIRLLTEFVNDYRQGIDECHRPEFELEKLVNTKMTSMADEDANRFEVNLISCLVGTLNEKCRIIIGVCTHS